MSHWFESKFNSYDGETLFYRYRRPLENGHNALLLLHRGHEHSGRIMTLADQLAQEKYWCFAFDMRGHGLSGGKRAWAENFDVWVRDLNCFAGHIRQIFGIEIRNTVLVANSVGAVMAVRWILNYGANLRGCILAAPAFSIKLYIPFALSFLRMIRMFSANLFVTSYVRSNLLTRDEKQAQDYDDDLLITRKIGVNVLVSLYDAAKNCFVRLRDFETPVVIFTAEKDFIVRNRFHRQFYSGISSKFKKHIVLKNFRHAVFHEKEPSQVIEPARKFIKSVFDEDTKQLPIVAPRASTHTVNEYTALCHKGSLATQIYYSTYRRLLHTLGRHSKGIATGLQYGFDSGISLDYVYEHIPRGNNWIGKLLDGVYINSVGWKGIRIRKKNLTFMLQHITKDLHNQDKRPVIFDVASGPGRYLFELQQRLGFPIQLYLNDEDINCISRAQQIATQFDSRQTYFLNQNVFDLFNSDSFPKTPNIIVISGLFELYESNEPVLRLIDNLYDLLEEGGYLVYTGQPWHPQLKLIARLLNNRHGKRWIMRRRIQTELDGLIESTGFIKLTTETDDKGIFTVSCARKDYTKTYGVKNNG